MTRIIGIMAVASNGVVGRNGNLPWNIPSEIQHFRQTTQGCSIIMGRKTFDSMPDEHLNNRPLYVFSKQPIERKGVTCKTFTSFSAFLEQKPHLHDMYMIGGADIARLFLAHQALDGFVLTRIHEPYDGDVKLNLDLFHDWQHLKEEVYDTYTVYHLKPPYAKGITLHDFFIQPTQHT